MAFLFKLDTVHAIISMALPHTGRRFTPSGKRRSFFGVLRKGGLIHMTLMEVLTLLTLLGGAIYGTFQISFMIFQHQARQEREDNRNEKK